MRPGFYRYRLAAPADFHAQFKIAIRLNGNLCAGCAADPFFTGKADEIFPVRAVKAQIVYAKCFGQLYVPFYCVFTAFYCNPCNVFDHGTDSKRARPAHKICPRRLCVRKLGRTRERIFRRIIFPERMQKRPVPVVRSLCADVRKPVDVPYRFFKRDFVIPVPLQPF